MKLVSKFREVSDHVRSQTEPLREPAPNDGSERDNNRPDSAIFILNGIVVVRLTRTGEKFSLPFSVGKWMYFINHGQ